MRRSTWKGSLAAVAAVALLLAGCGGTSGETSADTGDASADASEPAAPDTADPAAAGDGAFPLTLTDAEGNEHTFAEPPRLGCAWAGCREGLADLGVPPHAEGFAQDDQNVFNYPAGAPELTIDDTQNPEQWAAAEVDLIIKRVPATPEDAALEQAAPIFYLHHPTYGESSQTGVGAYYENMLLLGQLTGEPEAAQAAIDRFDATLAALEAAAPEGAAGTSFASLFGNFDTYRVSGTENPFCDTLAAHGFGQCVDAETGEMNGEAFLALDPDWIGVMVSDDAPGGADRDDPVWDRLTAVRDGHVYEAENRIYCCSLRGLTHALQEYAHFVWGPGAGIPDPGDLADFDPATEAVR